MKRESKREREGEKRELGVGGTRRSRGDKREGGAGVREDRDIEREREREEMETDSVCQ